MSSLSLLSGVYVGRDNSLDYIPEKGNSEIDKNMSSSNIPILLDIMRWNPL